MADQRRGDRLLNAARVIGLVALLGGLVLLAVVIFTQSVEKAGSWAGVLGTSLAIVGMVVTILTSWWRQRSAAAAPVTPEVLAQAAEVLASRVAEQWQREAEARSLGDPDPMPVRWTLSDDSLMDHEEHIAPAPVMFTGCSDRMPELVDEFRKLHRSRLVIVGGPGSGKTTLAVQLVLQLLADPRPGDPVPVLLSMVSWAPDAQPRVQDWLTGQLDQAYPALSSFGRDTARRLVEQGRVLPVLDGLDELPEQRRPQVITALNASLRDGGVILTSRITEYTSAVGASRVLTAAAVVGPEPLTRDEVADYLAARLPRHPNPSWQKVLAALREGTAGALSTVATTPLGLWLLRTVSIDARHDPEALIDTGQYPDPRSIQTHLLAELIPATLRSRPPSRNHEDPLRPKRPHDPDDVRRWLTSLAIELRDAGSRDWRWWHLARHTFSPRQFGLMVGLAAALVVGLAAALVVGLAAALGAGLAIALGAGLTVELVVGLATALGGGLMGGLFGVLVVLLGGGWLGAQAVGLLSKRAVGGLSVMAGGVLGGLAGGMLGGVLGGLAGELLGGRAGVRVGGLLGGLLGVMAGGLGVGLAGGFLGGLVAEPVRTNWRVRVHSKEFRFWMALGLVIGLETAALGTGLAFGLASGLAIGLNTFMTSADMEQRAASPVTSVLNSRRHQAVIGLGALAYGLGWGLVFGLGTGLAFGLAFGLVVALDSALVAFYVAGTLRAAQGWLPWRGL